MKTRVTKARMSSRAAGKRQTAKALQSAAKLSPSQGRPRSSPGRCYRDHPLTRSARQAS